jgi:F420-dependent oxidoreductase-like protein
MIKVGFQIPSFTHPGVGPDVLFERVAAAAVAAEEAGADAVMVMDHFYQLPLLGPPDLEMLEGYTLLGGLAARTRTAMLGTLVTGVTYRNPAILAKIVTTLDVISSGRAFLGIGAAWFDVEHRGLGVDFPPVKERFERLEEALHICRAMFRGERPTFEGRHYRTHEAINSPAPVRPGGPPIMIGGQGEKKTLRLMAEHAEMANFTSGFDELPRKLDVLAGHCDDVGRDPSTINKTGLSTMIHAATQEDAERLRNEFLRARGMDWDALDDGTRELLSSRLLIGGPDAVGERIQAMIAVGLDGVCFNLPASWHDPEAVASAVATAVQAVG